MADSEIQQPDIPADQSPDELDALLSQFEAETARPAAANGDENLADGHADNDAPVRAAPDSGEANGKTLEDAISDAEIAERTQRSRAYYASLQLDQKIQTIKQHEYQQDLNSTIANVRGSLDKNQIRDAHVQAWLDTQVRQDEAIKQAWLDRAENPKIWKAAERNLKAQFHKEFSRQVLDIEVTEDRTMVAAAIRGASVPTPVESAPNYARLSNPEMRDEMRKLGIEPNF